MLIMIMMTIAPNMSPDPWRAEFTTSGEWQSVDLSFDDFVPVFRGRRVPQAGPVVPSAIRQVGFMLADNTPGPFELEVQSIVFMGRQ